MVFFILISIGCGYFLVFLNPKTLVIIGIIGTVFGLAIGIHDLSNDNSILNNSINKLIVGQKEIFKNEKKYN